jgi:hypothetical protein
MPISRYGPSPRRSARLPSLTLSFCFHQKLAAKHTDTLFVKTDVANAPFLVTKLEVKVLPCVIGFVDGVSKMKSVFFSRHLSPQSAETDRSSAQARGV